MARSSRQALDVLGEAVSQQHIADFLHDEIERTARFMTWWMNSHQEDPEMFPLEMEPGQWDEQLRIYDDPHELVVISPETIQEAMEKAHTEGRLDTYHAISGGDLSSIRDSLRGTVSGRTPAGEPNQANKPKNLGAYGTCPLGSKCPMEEPCGD